MENEKNLKLREVVEPSLISVSLLQSLVYLFNKGKKERFFIWVLRLGLVGMIFLGSLHEAKVMWDLGDIGVAIMAWVNIIVILLLSPKAFKALRSYERQKKEGKAPVFDPKEIGIDRAEYWEKKGAGLQ